MIALLAQHTFCATLLLMSGVFLLWGIVLTGYYAVPRIGRFILRSMDEQDTASSMRLGFLETITALSLCALIGVITRFDCAAFWGALATSFVAAFAAKGWQRVTELSAKEAA